MDASLRNPCQTGEVQDFHSKIDAPGLGIMIDLNR